MKPRLKAYTPIALALLTATYLALDWYGRGGYGPLGYYLTNAWHSYRASH